MRRRHGQRRLFLRGALLKVALLSCLLSGGLAVCPSACSCSRSHREVDCSWKGLGQLPDGLQHNVRGLILSHNRFHNLDGQLKQYTHLRYLDLSHNRLSHLPRELPRSLWQLSASSNHLQLLDKNDTAYQWNLQTLDLSNNRLERVTFINNTLPNLRALNLSRNHFWTLPTNLPQALETIDLSHNLLVKVLPGSLDRLAGLTHLYLHANRFSLLPGGVLDKLGSLQVITLGNNPWACHMDDDMAYVLWWSQRTPALVLGCPCHTRPVCGGIRPSRGGGWRFASHTTPPFARGVPDLSSVPPEARVTWWWNLLASSSTAPDESFHSPPSTSSAADAYEEISQLPASAPPPHIDHFLFGKSDASPPHTADYFYFSAESLVTEMSTEDKGSTSVLFTTQIPPMQTKKTTTLRTRSVRRQNPLGSGCSGVAPSPLLLFSHHVLLSSLSLLRLS